MPIQISLKELFERGAHFGHQAKRWNPKMAPYIYGVQEGIHIFDLVKTKEALEEALEVITKAVLEGKVLLLVGTKKQAKEKIMEIGRETNTPYVSERWLGGTLTNFDQIKKSLKKITEMKAKMAAGEYDKYTKKERLLLEKEIDHLDRFFGGIVSLEKLPDILIIIDTHKELGAVKEARKANIEIVGIVDSNADPTLVDYPIPMNDDAAKAIEYVLGLIKEAILEGKKKLKSRQKKKGKE